MISVPAFVQKYSGQKVTSPTGGYTGECVSLVKQFIADNNWQQLWGNAIDYQHNGYGQYVWIKNWPWTVPQAGDFAVFQIGTYGHIGIVLAGATTRSMQIFNQNWPLGNDTNPATVTTFDYVHPKCIGFLRHK